MQNKIAKARHPALYHNAARVCVGGGWTVRKRQVCRVATKCMAKFCKQFLQYYYFHREVPAAHFGARKKIYLYSILYPRRGIAIYKNYKNKFDYQNFTFAELSNYKLIETVKKFSVLAYTPWKEAQVLCTSYNRTTQRKAARYTVKKRTGDSG